MGQQKKGTGKFSSVVSDHQGWDGGFTRKRHSDRKLAGTWAHGKMYAKRNMVDEGAGSPPALINMFPSLRRTRGISVAKRFNGAFFRLAIMLPSWSGPTTWRPS